MCDCRDAAVFKHAGRRKPCRIPLKRHPKPIPKASRSVYIWGDIVWYILYLYHTYYIILYYILLFYIIYFTNENKYIYIYIYSSCLYDICHICIICLIHYTLYIIHVTVYIIHCTLHIISHTWCIMCYIMYVIHYRLDTSYYMSYITCYIIYITYHITPARSALCTMFGLSLVVWALHGLVWKGPSAIFS